MVSMHTHFDFDVVHAMPILWYQQHHGFECYAVVLAYREWGCDTHHSEDTINAGQGIELIFIVEVDAQAADGPRDSDFMIASARPDNQIGNNLTLLSTTVLANLVATDSYESCGDS